MSKKEERTRVAGVLMPIFSLPGRYGIGCVSKEAFDFVDFLAAAGQSLWQVLPLGPTSYGDSPYQSFSSFAGNPYFIGLETLIERDLLSAKKCGMADLGDNKNDISYDKLYVNRFPLLRKAFKKSDVENDPGFKEFCEKNADWLYDYALFMAVKNVYEGKSFLEWDEDIKNREDAALAKYRKKCRKDILFYEFLQYEFFSQWKQLKDYANSKGIKLAGDIPIYAALDSSDVWSNPELFQLNEDCTPKAVAGCPPDAFSATGQLWGNPLYDWDCHRKTGFEWWIKRLEKCFEMYDIVRIDHFRGFEGYYSIPAKDETAEHGHWEKGPGIALFDAVKKKLGDVPVIAEDLGFLTPDVIKLLADSGYPGMKVLEFAFDHREPSDYLPHNYGHNCVVYTGTHDNETALGWARNLNKKDRRFCKAYLGCQKTKEIPAALIKAAHASPADMSVIPMWDYLELGNEARINTPSTLGENWRWRMSDGLLTKTLAKRMKKLAKTYDRV